MLYVSGRYDISVAKKIIENAAKGNPHFKPHKGAHGACSWFYVSGSAHAGLSGAKIEVHASIAENYYTRDNDLVWQAIRHTKKMHPEWLTPENRNNSTYVDALPRFRAKFDVEAWNWIGSTCAARNKATLLSVPKCKLTMEPGKFLLVPPSVAPYLIVDFDMSKNANVGVFDVGNFFADARSLEAWKNQKSDLSPVVTLWIGPYTTADQTSAEKAMWDIDAGLSGWYGTTRIKRTFTFRTVKFRTDPLNDQGVENRSGAFGVVSLTYTDYRSARNAYKRLLPVANKNPKVHCFAGENWTEEKKLPVALPDGQTLGSAVEKDVLQRSYALD